MYEILIDGMTCGGCVKSLTNALKTMDPSSDILIELETKKLKIKTTKDLEMIKETIKEAGFTPK